MSKRGNLDKKWSKKELVHEGEAKPLEEKQMVQEQEIKAS